MRGERSTAPADGFLASFVSASQAVACAVAVQRGLLDYNASAAAPVAIQVRIGLGAGEPLADGEALFGSTVNLAARICASADPSQILVARVVVDLCTGKPFVFRRRGEATLKGFAEPVDLYLVDWNG